jgi:hypothetical protein
MYMHIAHAVVVMNALFDVNQLLLLQLQVYSVKSLHAYAQNNTHIAVLTQSLLRSIATPASICVKAAAARVTPL